MRKGFTLIEALVALVLFQVGMLALAATTAIAARDLATVKLRTRANAIARNRVELLRASACSAAETGSAQPTGMIESWRVEGGPGWRVVIDSVSFQLPAGRRGDAVHRAWVMCAR